MKDTLKKIKDTPIFLKIPFEGEYIGDIDEFDKEKAIIVEGEEMCEVDKYGNKCSCWYISTTVGACKESLGWLVREIVECGYTPGFADFYKGIFSEKFIREYNEKYNTCY